MSCAEQRRGESVSLSVGSSRAATTSTSTEWLGISWTLDFHGIQRRQVFPAIASSESVGISSSAGVAKSPVNHGFGGVEVGWFFVSSTGILGWSSHRDRCRFGRPLLMNSSAHNALCSSSIGLVCLVAAWSVAGMRFAVPNRGLQQSIASWLVVQAW